MRIDFNVGRLCDLLHDFFRLTNISTSIFNTDHSVAYSNSVFPRYCETVRSTTKEGARCSGLDKEACKKAMESGEPVTYTCHGGICETVMPIYYDSVFIGFFVFGQYVDKSNHMASEEAMLQCCNKYGLDPGTMRKYRAELAVLDEEQQQSVVRMFNVLLDSIIARQYIHPSDGDLLAEILEYIRENYEKPLSVELLCRKFFLSRRKLYTLFNKSGLTSPIDYIRDIRLEKAKELLTATSLPITKIAESVGIGNYNYFIRSFRKKYGVPPGMFRKSGV